ncbi:MAG: DNA starvation/stationary phase protection protein Dps [Candidatus Eisenbacteria bacterium]
MVRTASTTTDTMFPTKNNIPETNRTQLVTLLNRRLADAVDLGTQIKQAHWNVKGPTFIAIHRLLDEVYAGIGEYADLIAERIVQLGGIAVGSARDIAERSEMDEYPLTAIAAAEHVKYVSAALGAFGGRVRFAIGEADELEDAVTADICTEVARGVDKLLWLVEAHGQG